eukprot:SAG31_NODE_73_length_27793_cov_26.900520_21_plen_82_part_00
MEVETQMVSLRALAEERAITVRSYLANPLGNHHFSWSRRAHDTEARPSTCRNSVPPSVDATIGVASGASTGLLEIDLRYPF